MLNYMLYNVKYFVIKLANLVNQPIFIKGGAWRYLNVKKSVFHTLCPALLLKPKNLQ